MKRSAAVSISALRNGQILQLNIRSLICEAFLIPRTAGGEQRRLLNHDRTVPAKSKLCRCHNIALAVCINEELQCLCIFRCCDIFTIIPAAAKGKCDIRQMILLDVQTQRRHIMLFFYLFADFQYLIPGRRILIAKSEFFPHRIIYNKYTRI